MVDFNKIIKSEQEFVNEIIIDIKVNNYSYECLEYIHRNFAQIEINGFSIAETSLENYEERLKRKDVSIRINRGGIYEYIEINEENIWSHNWNDEIEEYEEYEEDYAKYKGNENSCVPSYVKFN